jgi:hypothetical protein
MSKIEVDLKQTKQKLKETLESLIKEVSHHLKPIKKMNDKQIYSIITLSWITQGITQALSMCGDIGDNLLEKFKGELIKINPNLTHIVGIKTPHGACLAESIAYATIIKACQDQGLEEDECPGAGNAAAAVSACLMENLSDMGGKIKDLIGGRLPVLDVPTR